MIRCVVSDLDGTLVKTSMNEVDDKTVARLIELQEQGVKVILASGRPLAMMKEIGRMLQLEKYGGFLIANNGYEIYDCLEDRLEKSDLCIDDRVLRYTFGFASKHVSYLAFSSSKTAYSYGFPLVRHLRRMYFYIRLRKSAHGYLRVYTEIKDLEDVVEPIYKVGVATYSRRTLVLLKEALARKFADVIEPVLVNPRYLDIMPKGISKGNALLTVLKKLNIDPQEVVAFGDAENDVSMMQCVGVSVAMGNGMTHVKEIATFVSDSNVDDGVLKGLNQVFEQSRD